MNKTCNIRFVRHSLVHSTLHLKMAEQKLQSYEEIVEYLEDKIHHLRLFRDLDDRDIVDPLPLQSVGRYVS